MIPKIAVPEFEVKLLSQKAPTKFRPYLVKEEKLLLMAQQSKDPKEIEGAVRSIIDACTFSKINPYTLPPFDLEYLFLQLRARSVNNVVEINFICQHDLTDTTTGTFTKKCGCPVPVSVNLDDIKLVVPEGHTNLFWLTDDIGVTLKYPTAEVYEKVLSGGEALIVELLPSVLETIFTKSGEVTEIAAAEPNEVKEFVESLQLTQLDKVRVFFDTMPRLEHTVQFKCPKCSYEENITLTGLQDFFD